MHAQINSSCVCEIADQSAAKQAADIIREAESGQIEQLGDIGSDERRAKQQKQAVKECALGEKMCFFLFFRAFLRCAFQVVLFDQCLGNRSAGNGSQQ